MSPNDKTFYFPKNILENIIAENNITYEIHIMSNTDSKSSGMLKDLILKYIKL